MSVAPRPLLTGSRSLLAASISALLLVSCASDPPRRDPTGALFPTVRGESLDGASLELPIDLNGEPAILLIGHGSRAQPDIDRWLPGLTQLETPVHLLEVPTAEGVIADEPPGGMRSDTPPTDRASFVTLSGDDASRVVELTGSAPAPNARVLLLDTEGRIAWFADDGWSASSIAELDGRTRELLGSPVPNGSSSIAMTEEHPLLLDFSDPKTAGRFTAVDDRVMGGVSRSRLRHLGDSAAFEGELSTEQNGGFASVRSDVQPVDLSAFEGFTLHVRGDGRTYKLRVRTNQNFDGVNYQTSFGTTAGTWTTIRLPFTAFRPTYRGRLVARAPALDPSLIKSFGLLVADKQIGSFQLELRGIGTYPQG